MVVRSRGAKAMRQMSAVERMRQVRAVKGVQQVKVGMR